jgi:hypothetical protein
MTPTGGPHLSARERREEERGFGWADRAGGGGEQAGPAGPCEEDSKERRKDVWAWAAWKKKREGKKKERVGRAQRENEGEKELRSNIFEFELKFKLKWKTNNKIM